MNFSRLVFPLVCIVSILAGAVFFHFITEKPLDEAVEPESTSSIDNSPNIRLETIPLLATDGSNTTIAQFDKDLIVINFWAPWCAPCREEIPDLIALQNSYSDHLQIIGLAADSAENVEEFEKDFNMNYPSFLTESLMPLYMAVFENQSSVLPFTAVLDSKRDLVFTHQGEISLQLLESAVIPLISDSR